MSSSSNIYVVVHFPNNTNIKEIRIPILKSNSIDSVTLNIVDKLNFALGSHHEYHLIYKNKNVYDDIYDDMYKDAAKTFNDLDKEFGSPSSNEYHFYAAIDLTKYKSPFTKKNKHKSATRNRRSTNRRSSRRTGNRRRETNLTGNRQSLNRRRTSNRRVGGRRP